MSFFKRLFSTDPATLLDKAERALEGSTPVETLNLLARLPDELPDELGARREALDTRAHDAIARASSERARGYEEAGLKEQAVDSLSLALEHCRDEELRADLRQRLARAKRPAVDPLAAAAVAAAAEAATAEAATAEEEAEADARAEADEEADEDEPPTEEEVEASYFTHVSMLNEDFAERYEDRPESFQQAYLDLNEGRAAEALPVFEELVREAPDDPVGPLERGRCLLFLGRVEEAQADFEKAWEALGDEPLDASQSLSVPILWAETAAVLGQHEQVVERLSELGAADRRQPVLAHVLGRALIELGRLDEAYKHLRGCVRAFPREQVFAHLLAEVLVANGEAAAAIHVLERAVAPSCAGGGCRAPALHLPAARLLAGLHLDEGSSTKRPRELLGFIAAGLKGRLEWGDLVLLARCERQDGDEEACLERLAQARKLVPADAEQAHALLDSLEAAKG